MAIVIIIRPSSNGIPSSSKIWVFPKKLKNTPKQNIRTKQTSILLKVALSKVFAGIANYIAAPIIKIKNEKTMSVGVQPFHSECNKGVKLLPSYRDY